MKGFHICKSSKTNSWNVINHRIIIIFFITKEEEEAEKSYLERKMKEVQIELAINQSNRIESNRTLGNVLDDRKHIAEDLNAFELKRGVDVRRGSGLEVSLIRRDVPQLLSSVTDPYNQRRIVDGVEVRVADLNAEV